MKPITTLLLSLTFLFSQPFFSQSDQILAFEKTDLFAHMAEVNVEWLKHPELNSITESHFASEEDRISEHLKLVIEYLNENSPTTFSESQISNRVRLLNLLSDYAEKKVFPTNTNHSQRQPYFIDDFGVHCAVGYLIAESGNGDLANKISDEYNYDYIKDIKTDGLMQWANEYGFTLDELKWIQPGYVPITYFETLGLGTNGPVKVLKTDENEQLIFAGAFDIVDGFPCMNIGTYQDNQLSCLDQGISGVINDIAIIENVGIVAAGALEYMDVIYPLAIYEDNQWTFLTIPDRAGAIGQHVDFGLDGYKVDLTISHETFPDQQELWYLSDTDIWERKLLINGQINDLVDAIFGRFYVGQFDYIIRDGSTAINEIDNVMYRVATGTSFNDFGSQDDYSLDLQMVKNIGGALYFGGTCTANTGQPKICLTRFFGGNFQTVLTNQDPIRDRQINDIIFDGESSLIFGGDLDYEYFSGDYGKHLLIYNLLTGSVTPHAYFDHPVNSLTMFNDEIHLGGDFTSNYFQQELPRLAKITVYTGVEEILDLSSKNFYPNPFTEKITANGNLDNFNYKIYSITGQLVKQGVADGQTINGLDNLDSGLYTIHINHKGQLSNHKIIKE